MKTAMKGRTARRMALLCALALTVAMARGGPGAADRPGQDGQGRPGEMREPEATEEEIEKTLEFLKKEVPELHKHLSMAKEVHPEAFRQHIRGIVHAWRDPDIRPMFVLNVRADMRLGSLVNTLKEKGQGAGAVDESLKKDLQEALGKKLEAETVAMETQIKKMQGMIAKLKKDVRDRKSRKDEMLQTRLAGLLDELGRGNP